jgi:hypothetical protein
MENNQQNQANNNEENNVNKSIAELREEFMKAVEMFNQNNKAPNNSPEPPKAHEEGKGLKDIFHQQQKELSEKEELEELRKFKKETESNKAVSSALDILIEKGLPANSTIAQNLVSSDEKETLNNINAFEKMYKKAVEEGVKKALAENGFEPPKQSDTKAFEGKSTDELTKLCAQGKITFAQFNELMKGMKN